MNTDQTQPTDTLPPEERIKQLEEQLQQANRKYSDLLAEISDTYTATMNRAERLEKENHVLQLKLQAEIERNQLRRKRRHSDDSPNFWPLVMGIFLLLFIVALVSHFRNFPI